ncbi:hypothetical protein BEI_0691 [Halomonas beimenensis]|uniref:Uncharacterized protein n=1 Tax=Halomonas beimenensis TaxID=475662 RepID=A0A291P481_9GAMM|nr:hypothetical protein BEI_0691 [Halomonas beimenensis]
MPTFAEPPMGCSTEWAGMARANPARLQISKADPSTRT